MPRQKLVHVGSATRQNRSYMFSSNTDSCPRAPEWVALSVMKCKIRIRERVCGVQGNPATRVTGTADGDECVEDLIQCWDG